MDTNTAPVFNKYDLKKKAKLHARFVYDQMKNGHVLPCDDIYDYLDQYPHSVKWVHSPSVGKVFTGDVSELMPCHNEFCSARTVDKMSEYKGYYSFACSTEGVGTFGVLCHDCFCLYEDHEDWPCELFDDYVYNEIERLMEEEPITDEDQQLFIEGSCEYTAEVKQHLHDLLLASATRKREFNKWCTELCNVVDQNNGDIDHDEAAKLIADGQGGPVNFCSNELCAEIVYHDRTCCSFARCMFLDHDRNTQNI